jgi:hypothetical protein
VILRAGKFSVFGELLSQPSRLAPNAVVDATIGQMVAAGLATSATVLCTSLLRSATKCEPPLLLPKALACESSHILQLRGCGCMLIVPVFCASGHFGHVMRCKAER